MKLLRDVVLLAVCAVCVSGCSLHRHRHRVGAGPVGTASESARQYYWFFGMFRLNEVDTQRMSDDLASYEIVTEFAFTDLLLSALLLPVTVTTRSVTVNK